jgi:hypothetical protein
MGESRKPRLGDLVTLRVHPPKGMDRTIGMVVEDSSTTGPWYSSRYEGALYENEVIVLWCNTQKTQAIPDRYLRVVSRFS